MTTAGQRCPDTGACHHRCPVRCFRVEHCGPLTGVFPDDRWPAGMVAPVAPPSMFEWLRKVGGTRRHAVPVEQRLFGSLCGVTVAKVELWRADPGCRRCQKCVAIVATDYPSLMPGVRVLAAALDVEPIESLRMIEQAQQRDTAGLGVVAYLTEITGVNLTLWQIEVLEQWFGERGDGKRADGSIVEPLDPG